MRLFDFFKTKSYSGKFVNETSFKSNRDIQMEMTTQKLERLRKQNVSADKELRLQYFFYTNTADNAKQLANEIEKLNYTVKHGVSAEDKKIFIVSGWTTKMIMADKAVKRWTKQMCELGFKFDCEFDGWGTDPDQNKKTAKPEKAYEELRNTAFLTTPEQLGLFVSSEKTTVYGIIMDWEVSGATATTVAYQTGEANLYLSTGSGVIGGGQHHIINSVSKQFVSIAQTFINKATKTATTPLPSNNEVKFYFLTNEGIFVGQEQMKNFQNHSSAWLKLFEAGNKVLTELRKISITVR